MAEVSSCYMSHEASAVEAGRFVEAKKETEFEFCNRTPVIPSGDCREHLDLGGYYFETVEALKAAVRASKPRSNLDDLSGYCWASRPGDIVIPSISEIAALAGLGYGYSQEIQGEEDLREALKHFCKINAGTVRRSIDYATAVLIDWES